MPSIAMIGSIYRILVLMEKLVKQGGANPRLNGAFMKIPIEYSQE